MDNRFLSVSLTLKIRKDRADRIVQKVARKSVHAEEALEIFRNGGAIPCLRFILRRDYLIETTYGEDWITADSEVYPIYEDPWPGLEFIEFMKSISPAIMAGGLVDFLMLGHTVLTLHFTGGIVGMWTPREPVTHWDSTYLTEVF